jgi:hypothetical protein
MKVDLKNSIDLAQSLAPAARTASANGTGVDLAGYNSAVIVFHPGAITDGTHTPSVEESDSSGSGYSAVAAADLIGSVSALAANTIQRVGYKGSKRYVRAVITVTGSPSTGAVAAASVIRGDAIKQPLS